MTCLIEKMIDEIEGAEGYCKAAKESDNPEARRMYKELALAEIGHFDRLASMYQQKMSSGVRTMGAQEGAHSMDLANTWFKYFKEKAEKLKLKINEL